MRFRRRSLVSGATVLVALAAVLVPLPAAAAPTGSTVEPSAADKIRPELRQRLTARSATAVPMWVRFDGKAELTAAAAKDDWAERGTAVAEALQRTAEASQRDVRKHLDDAGTKYKAFWATNAVYVPEGSLQLAEELAAQTEVEALHATTSYDAPAPVKGEETRAAAAVEWGIANIKADAVWSQYGADGKGITIANIDTGAQYDHPALVNQYRGKKADGSFDHNYNWFDAAGTCGNTPCDDNGHGTHTMGTMAGSEGIGVAPGVRWIAANGCCPSDLALIESGQWMLQPRDLAGENADASKRPHIVNNSWGGQSPSNDPFMEDITQAWAASGIFGVWSNGNLGPACDTSSTPGSRTGNYSVGAYDTDNAIADFSSRGTGQDGEIKPNLSAPGVNVRSAIPGNRYTTASGTSMAAPHVAGAIALLWSAAPAITGDVAATRSLLDGTGRDAADTACGGTADDNNVFGEGRLDALALVDAAPVGETGTLRMKVTDKSGRTPITDARITVVGPVERDRFTGSDGTYALPLPTGEYTVKVTAFGYVDNTFTATVTAGNTIDRAVRLTPLPRVDITGTVKDGSGQGWPLYAKLTLSGVPGGTVYTRPVDGRYSFSLPAGATYKLTVESQYGGYESVNQELVVGRKNLHHDIAVPVIAKECSAAGYGVAYDGSGSEFTAGQPAGWTVTDAKGNGQVWRFDNPGNRANWTGGKGGFALVDSYRYGSGDGQDTMLVSPLTDLSGQATPVVGFKQDYKWHFRDTAKVDLSIDGGATWQNLLTQTGTNKRGPREEVIPVPQAANQPDVRVRFHYTGSFDDWWEVDDVYLGARRCAPLAGGLVLGHVQDRNTGGYLNGAIVTSTARSTEQTKSVATPTDPALADGFYWMFAAKTGSQSFTAAADSYVTDRQAIWIGRGAAIKRDFSLPAGRLKVTPAISESEREGDSAYEKVTVTNTGTAPTQVRLSERLVLSADQQAATGLAAGADVQRIEGDYSPLGFASGEAKQAAGRPVPVTPPWANLPDHPGRIMDNAVAEHGGLVYSVGGVDGLDIVAKASKFDPATRTWTPIADLPEGRENASAAFLNGKLYVTGGWNPNVRATKTTFVYDEPTNSWSQVADAPTAAAAAGRAVLDGKLYLVGGCTNACDSNEVRRYDPVADRWEVLAPYPESSGAGQLACGALDGVLQCVGGINRGAVLKSSYAYDPAANQWTRKADLPIDLWGMAYTASYGRLLVAGGITQKAVTNEGFAYHPDLDRWLRLPAANNLTYRGGSACGLYRIGGSIGGFNPVDASEQLPTYGDCEPVDVPWLSLDSKTVLLAPGRSVQLTVKLDAGKLSAGVHQAGVWVKEDTPYLVNPVDVRLDVRKRR